MAQIAISNLNAMENRKRLRLFNEKHAHCGLAGDGGMFSKEKRGELWCSQPRTRLEVNFVVIEDQDKLRQILSRLLWTFTEYMMLCNGTRCLQHARGRETVPSVIHSSVTTVPPLLIDLSRGLLEGPFCAMAGCQKTAH